jgi:putative exosortase-associated protein (TIGR04073 family)
MSLQQKAQIMRNTLPFLAAAGLAAVLASGCSTCQNMEKKFGRGLSNTYEIVRLGDFRRTLEQSAFFEGPEYAQTTGFYKGLHKSLARTGIGIYEMVTAPIPPYDPICTDYLSPGPVYPDNYAPGIIADSTFASDTYLGFSGGDVFPMVPGSRFRIFDTQ